MSRNRTFSASIRGVEKEGTGYPPKKGRIVVSVRNENVSIDSEGWSSMTVKQTLKLIMHLEQAIQLVWERTGPEVK